MELSYIMEDERQSNLDRDGLIITLSAEIGREVDKINLALDAGEDPFQEATGLRFWSENFGPQNKVRSWLLICCFPFSPL